MKKLTKEFIEEINSSNKHFSFYKKNDQLNNSINLDDCQITSLSDVAYYQEIITNSKFFFEYFVDSRTYVKNLLASPSVCNHFHSITPKTPYLGIRYSLTDANNLIFYRIKFSPFFSEQSQRVEFNLGIVFNNPREVMSMKKFQHFFSNFTLTSCTNMSPSNLYIYRLTNLHFPKGLDKTHPQYATDIKKLNEYAFLINHRIPQADCYFDDAGIFCCNKKVKIQTILSLTSDIPFYNTSSYIIFH